MPLVRPIIKIRYLCALSEAFWPAQVTRDRYAFSRGSRQSPTAPPRPKQPSTRRPPRLLPLRPVPQPPGRDRPLSVISGHHTPDCRLPDPGRLSRLAQYAVPNRRSQSRSYHRDRGVRGCHKRHDRHVQSATAAGDSVALGGLTRRGDAGREDDQSWQSRCTTTRCALLVGTGRVFDARWSWQQGGLQLPADTIPAGRSAWPKRGAYQSGSAAVARGRSADLPRR